MIRIVELWGVRQSSAPDQVGDERNGASVKQIKRDKQSHTSKSTAGRTTPLNRITYVDFALIAT